MATTSPLLRVPLPQATDTDQVPADMMTAFSAAEPYWVGRYASAAERTTYLTAASLGGGIRGMLSWVSSPGRYETHNGTQWVPLISSTLETDAFAIYGTNWDGVSPTRQVSRRYTATVGVGASGVFTVTFPTAFANGLLYADIGMADNTTGVLVIVPLLGSHRLSFIAGQALVANGVPVADGTTLIVRYTVIGW